jgi:hypothetical protein
MPHTHPHRRRGRRRLAWALGAMIALTAIAALPAAANPPDAFSWTIAKTADTTEVTLGPGQSVTVNYEVTVTPTGSPGATTDSCIEVVDSIADLLGTVCADDGATTFEYSVTFGPFEECEDREIENVASFVTADTGTTGEASSTFTVLCPRPAPNERTYHWQIRKTVSQPTVTLQPGQSTTVTYSVTVESTGFTDSDPEAAETVEVDECVEVSDSQVGVLGTVCVDDEPKTFTYTVTVGPYATCGPRTVDNTAFFAGNDTGSGGQATVALDVDVQCSGGCTRTIGYWKTHAGFGPQADVVTPLLPVVLGTPGGPKSVAVTTAATAVQLLSFNGSNNVFAPSNGINKLYAQLLAAKLNGLNGAATTSVAATIAAADAFLATNDSTSWSGLSKAQKNGVLAWMDELDRYNNGLGEAGHCD